MQMANHKVDRQERLLNERKVVRTEKRQESVIWKSGI
jgi:hypothetical protein